VEEGDEVLVAVPHRLTGIFESYSGAWFKIAQTIEGTAILRDSQEMVGSHGWYVTGRRASGLKVSCWLPLAWMTLLERQGVLFHD